MGNEESTMDEVEEYVCLFGEFLFPLFFLSLGAYRMRPLDQPGPVCRYDYDMRFHHQV